MLHSLLSGCPINELDEPTPLAWWHFSIHNFPKLGESGPQQLLRSLVAQAANKQCGVVRVLLSPLHHELLWNKGAWVHIMHTHLLFLRGEAHTDGSARQLVPVHFGEGLITFGPIGEANKAVALGSACSNIVDDLGPTNTGVKGLEVLR